MTVSTAKTYNYAFTNSSAGAVSSAAGQVILKAIAGGSGSLTVVDMFIVEKTGQSMEMTLLVQ